MCDQKQWVGVNPFLEYGRVIEGQEILVLGLYLKALKHWIRVKARNSRSYLRKKGGDSGPDLK